MSKKQEKCLFNFYLKQIKLLWFEGLGIFFLVLTNDYWPTIEKKIPITLSSYFARALNCMAE